MCLNDSGSVGVLHEVKKKNRKIPIEDENSLYGLHRSGERVQQGGLGNLR